MKIWILAVALLTSLPSLAGAASSGGADLSFLNQITAWYLGAQNTIRVCYEVAPGFGVENAALEQTIETGFATWSSYLDVKGIHARYAKKMQLTTQHRILPSCDGSQDLVFYFGVENKAVKEGRRGLMNPIAFAHQESYDPDLGWSKGFIWFSLPKTYAADFPDWTYHDQLQGMMLHELGHTLGCGHIRNTIMQEDILVVAQLSTAPENQYGAHIMLTHIDHEKELALSDTPALYKGFLPVDSSPTGHQTQEWLVGRPLDRNPTAVLKRLSKFSYALQVTDSQGTVEVAVTLGKNVFDFSSDQMAFHANLTYDDNYTPAAPGQMLLGTITGKDQSARPIALVRNSVNGGEGQISLAIANATDESALFYGNLPL